jgi:N-acetylneuraminic acid mutarotase
VFDIDTGAWSNAAPMLQPRNHHAALASGGVIYVFGGRDEQTSEITLTEAYDPATASWQPKAAMPTGRSGIAAAPLDDKVVVFGGEAFGSIRITFDDAEAYHPASDSWEALPPMPTARHGLGAATVSGRIYVLSGGPQAGLSYSDANEVLAPTAR